MEMEKAVVIPGLFRFMPSLPLSGKGVACLGEQRTAVKPPRLEVVEEPTQHGNLNFTNSPSLKARPRWEPGFFLDSLNLFSSGYD